MENDRIKIPSVVATDFGIFFGFFFFNSVWVAMRGLLLAAALLSAYYFCVGIQKALLRL